MVVMPHIGAMQFFGMDLEESYGFAQQFAGEGGHIATLPEIITARAQQPLASRIWNSYFTTSTSEYFGTSRGGNDIVIVAHGNGPMCDLKGIESAYKPRYTQSDGRPRTNHGHISLKKFRRLEDGDYGDVTIIDFAAVRKAYPERWFEYINIERASNDPLLQARLGRDWPTALLKLQLESRKERLGNPNSIPKSIKSDGPYPYWVKSRRADLPYGHLLSVTQDMHMHSGIEQFICMEVDVHERGNGKRFIGVRPGGIVAEVRQGPDSLSYSGEALALPNASESQLVPKFFPIRQFDGQWFSCTLKEGYAMDTCWPEYPVKEMEVIGSPGKIVSPGEMFFFRYDMAEVVWQAPEGANAYYYSEPRRTKVNGDDAIEADVYFCTVTLDTTQRCTPKTTLKGNFDLQMQLLERRESTVAHT